MYGEGHGSHVDRLCHKLCEQNSSRRTLRLYSLSCTAADWLALACCASLPLEASTSCAVSCLHRDHHPVNK